MGYRENDFYKKYIELDESISNERYINFCNSNSKVSIITQYIILFRRYYVSTIYLILSKLSCSVYSVARSACECFSIIYQLTESIENDNDFYKALKKEYQSNIKQLCYIYKNLQNDKQKPKMFERIKKMLLKTKKINGSEMDDDVINVGIKYKNNISNKVETAFKHIPEYADDKESYKNLYPELCLYSHNNIDGIMERFYDHKEEGIVINELKEDNNIFVIMHMFVSCTVYILKWIESIHL